MKKIFALFLAMFSIVLASCSNGAKQDLSSLRSDVVTDEFKTTLNINFDETQNSKRLYTGEEREKSFYDIYVAEDTANSLFVYNVNIHDEINKNLKSLPVSTLTFSDSLYTDELTEFLVEFYNEDYGVSKLDLGVTVDTSKSSKAWFKQAATTYLLPAKDAGVEDINISIVYLPTYFVRTYNNNVILKAYIFVPVYITYVSNNMEIVKPESGAEAKYALKDSTISGIKVVDLVFNSTQPSFLAAKPNPEPTTTATA